MTLSGVSSYTGKQYIIVEDHTWRDAYFSLWLHAATLLNASCFHHGSMMTDTATDSGDPAAQQDSGITRDFPETHSEVPAKPARDLRPSTSSNKKKNIGKLSWTNFHVLDNGDDPTEDDCSVGVAVDEEPPHLHFLEEPGAGSLAITPTFEETLLEHRHAPDFNRQAPDVKNNQNTKDVHTKGGHDAKQSAEKFCWSDDVEDDETEMPTKEEPADDEELVDLPDDDKEADPLHHAKIQRIIDGNTFTGEVKHSARRSLRFQALPNPL
jgi:hypothetical protein